MALWKRVRKRAAHRTRIALEYCRAKKDKEVVFLISSHRSGSNFLLGLLNSVPGVSFASEVLHPHMYYGLRSFLISKNSVLRHIEHSLNACEHGLSGAKLLFDQMERHRLAPGDLRRRFPRARFLLLYRRSLVDQFVSWKTAEKTGIWQRTDGFSPPSPLLRIDPEELKRFCLKTRTRYDTFLADPWIKERALVLDYESLAADPQGVFDRKVFPWLGQPASPVFSPFRKQSSGSGQRIQNYAEVLLLARNGWATQDRSAGRRPARTVSP